MKTVFEKTESLKDTPTHYCQGCGHGVVHRLVAEALDEMELRGKTIGVAPVGCSVLAYNYLDIDMIEVAHGRAPAVATGLKRCLPEHIVFTYQGDGDLASIGAAEILHATHRGENITVVFVNNAIYGMTGGQTAPTTMLEQVTLTSPSGRKPTQEGYPLQVSELLATMPGARFIERCSLHNPAHIRKTKKAINHAFELQADGGHGLCLVEILSPCPTYWRKSQMESRKWIEEEMIKVFPLGRFKG